jgi:hypothetical protein
MIEEAFTRMARKHKYTVGTDLRVAAKAIVVAGIATWRETEDKVARALELRAAIDTLELELQLGKDVGAFGSWNEFEAIVRLRKEVGAQSGGWLKQLRSKSQNGQAAVSPGQRAQILSSRDASPAGATP